MDWSYLNLVISENKRDKYIECELIDSSYSISVENENMSNVAEPIDYSIYRTPSGKEICMRCVARKNREKTIYSCMINRILIKQWVLVLQASIIALRAIYR